MIPVVKVVCVNDSSGEDVCMNDSSSEGCMFEFE